MSNNNEKTGDFFSRSLRSTFTTMSGVPEYQRPQELHDENMPAFLRNQLNGKQKKDKAWKDGWHNGFPPGAGA